MTTHELILSRDAYLLGVELSIFWSVAVLYGGAALVYVFHLLTRSKALGAAGSAVHWAAVLFNVALLAFRAFETGGAPVHSPHETLALFALSASLACLFVLRRIRGVYLPGLIAAAASALACFHALLAFTPEFPVAPGISSTGRLLATLHSTLTFASFGVITAAASIAAASLFLKTLLKAGPSPAYGLERGSLERFEGGARSLSASALPLLALAIITGAAWSESTLGRIWGWGFAETWSLVIFIALSLRMHAPGNSGKDTGIAGVFNLAAFCLIMAVVYTDAISAFSLVAVEMAMTAGLAP